MKRFWICAVVCTVALGPVLVSLAYAAIPRGRVVETYRIDGKLCRVMTITGSRLLPPTRWGLRTWSAKGAHSTLKVDTILFLQRWTETFVEELPATAARR